MNILDVKIEDLGITGEDKLDQIFRRQFELMQKYHSIEQANGLLITPDVPVNLHDAKGQFRLKDFAWRIIEELGEAMEAFLGERTLIHYKEEIADALHFLVEYTILSGMEPGSLSDSVGGDKLDTLFREHNISKGPNFTTVALDISEFMMYLATACNCLKNKPWKVTMMLTDERYFRHRVRSAWKSFIDICADSGIDSDDLTELYFRKSEVNKFRQRSNY